MLKKTLMALAMVGMAATPALADLLVPDQVINPPHDSGAGTIGIYGASVNGVPVASPGFLGGGGVASQVSIPANISDTIQVTFGFHWPFMIYYPFSPPRPVLGVQWQNRLVYDNSEVQVLGAAGAGGWTAENFGLGPNNSKMTANTSTATMVGVSGTPLKGFPDPTSGIITTNPGFGRFAVNPPNTTSLSFSAPTATVNGATMTHGMLIPFSSTFPIMRVTLHVKNVITDGNVDFFVPPTSAFLLFRVLTATTLTFARTPLVSTGSQIGLIGGDFGVDVVPEPASAALLGIGLFCLVGGAWRRRRRFGDVDWGI